MLRGSGSPKRKSSGERFTTSRRHDKTSIKSTPPLKLTRVIPGTRDGLIPNRVTGFCFPFIRTIFSHLLYTGSFFDLCTVTADTSRVPKPKIKNPRGTHFEVCFEVVLLFGLTELKAQLVWEEGGVEKRWVHLPPLSDALAKDEQWPGKDSIRRGRRGYQGMNLDPSNSFLVCK